MQQLESDLDVTQEKLMNANQRLEEKEKALQNAEGEVAALNRRVASLEEDLEKSEERLLTATQKLDLAATAGDDSQRMCKVLENKALSDEARMESLENQLKDARILAEEADKKYDDIAKKLQMVESDLDRAEERASQCNSDDVEDIRERMSVETGLVIVGGADDQLRLTNKKKKSELVTQGIVDRFIIDQIRNFLVSVLVKQPQTFGDRTESTFAVPTPESFGKKLKAKKRGGGGGGEMVGGGSVFVPANKKSRPTLAAVTPGAGGALSSPLPKTPPKKTRKPKKPKVCEGEAGNLLSNPLPASLLSISTPLPPTTLSPLKEPPPLPIRLAAGPGSPTPRVIHYAGRTGADNPTTPTWTVAVSRPVTASRPQ